MSTPQTAAGKRLWEGYRDVVKKRPDMDGILWLKAITDIEQEAAAAPAPELREALRQACYDCEDLVPFPDAIDHIVAHVGDALADALGAAPVSQPAAPAVTA